MGGLGKVTGRSRFGAAVKLPGMLHGKIMRNPHAHARIKGVEVSKALALPGVAAVITGADYPSLPAGTMAQLGDIISNL